MVRVTAPDLIERYLAELRASLRIPGAGWIIAEAEDHLQEGAAAGLAAGLTEREAQQAAISSFGSVRAVVRAHQTRWRGAVAGLSGLILAFLKVAGLFLAAFSLISLAGIAGIALGAHPVPLTGPAVQHLAAGIAGLILLAGCHLRSRARRRRADAAAVRSSRFPVAAVILFGATAAVLALLNATGAVPVGSISIGACLALAAGYAVRTRMQWRMGRTAR